VTYQSSRWVWQASEVLPAVPT